jgi:multidrug resistance efflux pump
VNAVRDTRPIRTPLRQRVTDLRGGPLSALAFLLAGFVLWWLLAVQTPSRAFVALVRGEPIVLRTLDDRVVTDVFVALHEHVAAGAPLVAFDEREVLAELAAARAEADALAADVEAQRSALELEAARFAVGGELEHGRSALEFAVERARRELAVEDARVELTALAVDRRALDVELRRYRVRRDLLAGLERQGLTPAAEFAELEERIRALDDQRAASVELEAELARVEAAARARLADFTATAALWAAPGAAPGPAPAIDLAAALEPLRRRVDAALALAAGLEARAEGLVLVAPAAGRVERLFAHVGLVTVAGEELVALVAEGPPRADVWVPEFARERLAVGDRLTLADPLEPQRVVEGAVLSSAPRVGLLPQRLWHDPARPEYGFAHLVELPEAAGLLPDTRLVARRESAPRP